MVDDDPNKNNFLSYRIENKGFEVALYWEILSQFSVVNPFVMIFFSLCDFCCCRDSKIMATATMATAAGAAALLYYTLNRKLQTQDAIDEDVEENGSETTTDTPLGSARVSHPLIQAPGTWLETISTLSETLRFTYSETLGKWPIGDLAFGISFLLKRQVMAMRTFLFFIGVLI